MRLSSQRCQDPYHNIYHVKHNFTSYQVLSRWNISITSQLGIAHLWSQLSQPCPPLLFSSRQSFRHPQLTPFSPAPTPTIPNLSLPTRAYFLCSPAGMFRTTRLQRAPPIHHNHICTLPESSTSRKSLGSSWTSLGLSPVSCCSDCTLLRKPVSWPRNPGCAFPTLTNYTYLMFSSMKKLGDNDWPDASLSDEVPFNSTCAPSTSLPPRQSTFSSCPPLLYVSFWVLECSEEVCPRLKRETFPMLLLLIMNCSKSAMFSYYGANGWHMHQSVATFLFSPCGVIAKAIH